MALTLRPELEVRIRRKVDSEGYQTVDQLLESALDRLDEANCGLTLKEFQAKINEGWDAAERGDTISGEEFETEMDAWRARVNAGL
jgi:hypothetical protein